MRSDDLQKLAEETMIEAWRLLLRMPDRDKGFLNAGKRTSLPEPIRDLWLGRIDADLALQLGLMAPEDEREPRRQLTTRDVAKVNKAWILPMSYAEAVPVPHAKLFMMVLAAKSGRMPGGFKWEDVGARLYGKRWGTARCDATTDALRMRYDACLRCVALRIVSWEIGLSPAPTERLSSNSSQSG